MPSNSKKRRSFLALLFAAGDVRLCVIKMTNTEMMLIEHKKLCEKEEK
jgi:hypothetical protein